VSLRPLAVYVHVPFCFSRCGYCDFNVYGGRHALEPAYLDGVLAEVAAWERLLRRRRVTSVYFGGGTPGEVPPVDLLAVLSAVRELAGAWDEDAEVTVEANPGTISDRALASLVKGGVNRVSFGVQSFDADELRFLDRLHSPEAAAASVHAARRAGAASVSIDLLYGVPGQTRESWRQTLERAASLPVDHISCYALTVEEGTRLARKVARGEVRMPPDEFVAEQYETAATLLAAYGFAQYELSNWARPGHESRHNLAYWTDREYLGIGCGAHGYVEGVRYENVAHPKTYIRALALGREGPAPPRSVAGVRTFPAVQCWHAADPALEMAEWVSLRLRLVEGFAVDEFCARFGQKLESFIGEELEEAVRAGVVEAVAGRIALTSRGRLLHGEVSARFLAALRSALPR